MRPDMRKGDGGDGRLRGGGRGALGREKKLTTMADGAGANTETAFIMRTSKGVDDWTEVKGRPNDSEANF